VDINITIPDGTLRSVPIERLYPNLRSYEFENNFRKYPHNFDRAGNARTTRYIRTLPTVLDIDSHYRRKVVLDLGSGSWGTNGMGTLRGLGDWLSEYPETGKSWSKNGRWDEYHEFDYIPDARKVGRPPWLNGTEVVYRFHNGLIGTSNISDHHLDFITFLKDTVTEEDFVLVKMDIENSEWCVIPEMIRSGTIHLVDELSVEMHFWSDDPAWYHFLKAAGVDKLFQNPSCPGKHDLAEAFSLLQRLRKLGIYTHTWP